MQRGRGRCSDTRRHVNHRARAHALDEIHDRFRGLGVNDPYATHAVRTLRSPGRDTMAVIAPERQVPQVSSRPVLIACPHAEGETKKSLSGRSMEIGTCRRAPVVCGRRRAAEWHALALLSGIGSDLSPALSGADRVSDRTQPGPEGNLPVTVSGSVNEWRGLIVRVIDRIVASRCHRSDRVGDTSTIRESVTGLSRDRVNPPKRRKGEKSRSLSRLRIPLCRWMALCVPVDLESTPTFE